MADAGVDDPFASLIIPNCQTTASQEEVLRRSRFAGESEAPVPADDDPPSGSLLGDSIEEEEEEPVTQIIIESLPDSQNDEEFQTPPEQATSQHFSSDDQVAAPARRTVSDGSTGGGGGGGGGEQDMEVDGEECGGEWRGVYLGQNADDLGFEGKKREIEIGGKAGKGIEVIDGLRKLRRVEGEFCVSRVCKERSGAGISSDVVMLEAEQTEMRNFGAENRESGFKEVAVGLRDRLVENAQKVSDKMPGRELEETVCAGQGKNASVENPVRESEVSKCIGSSDKMGKSGGGGGGGSGLARKSIEDIDKFKYVSTGGKRELPFSLRAQGKNVDAEASVAKKLPFSLCPQAKNVEAESTVAKKGVLGDLLDGLKLLMGGVDDGGSEDDDVLKTAKKCGMTFPRPRWWPPEGFDS